MQQAEALKQSLEALRKSAEAAGLGDTAWQRELADIRQQLERAITPELRSRLQELQQALKDLDADRTQECARAPGGSAEGGARSPGAEP